MNEIKEVEEVKEETIVEKISESYMASSPLKLKSSEQETSPSLVEVKAEEQNGPDEQKAVMRRDIGFKGKKKKKKKKKPDRVQEDEDIGQEKERIKRMLEDWKVDK